MSDTFLRLYPGPLWPRTTTAVKELVTARALVCLLLIFHFPLNAQQPLVWGYVHFPPFTYQGPDGKVRGFIADMTIKVMEKAGIPYTSIKLPNRRAKALINSGEIHFGLFAKSFIEDEAMFITSELPISQIELRAFWVGNNQPIRTKYDLRGKNLILMTAYTYGGLRDFIQDPANKISVVANIEQHHRAFQALKVGRGDYLLDYRGPSLKALSEMNIPDIQHGTLSTIDIFFMMHKSYPQAETTLEAMQQHFIVLYGQQKVKMGG